MWCEKEGKQLCLLDYLSWPLSSMSRGDKGLSAFSQTSPSLSFGNTVLTVYADKNQHIIIIIIIMLIKLLAEWLDLVVMWPEAADAEAWSWEKAEREKGMPLWWTLCSFHRSPHTHTQSSGTTMTHGTIHIRVTTHRIYFLSLSPLFVSLCRIWERQREGGRENLTTHRISILSYVLSLETIKYYFKWKWSFFIFTVNFLYFLLLFVKKIF